MSKHLAAITAIAGTLIASSPLQAATDHCLESPYQVTASAQQNTDAPRQNQAAAKLSEKRMDCESGQNRARAECRETESTR